MTKTPKKRGPKTADPVFRTTSAPVAVHGGTVCAKMTAARKRAFLKSYAATGLFVQSSMAASPHTQSRRVEGSFRAAMARDPEFKAQVENAQTQFAERLQNEAIRRAVDGVQKYVVQKGKIVSAPDGSPLMETAYSDRLMEVLLKAHVSKFEDKRRLEVSGHVETRVTHGLTLALEDVGLLPPAMRDQLADILDALAERKEAQKALPSPQNESVIDGDFSEVEAEEYDPQYDPSVEF